MTPTSTDPSAIPNSAGLGLFAIVVAVRRHWRAFVLLPAATVAIGVIAALTIPPTYTATAIFVPESAGEDLPSGLAGVAGQFGLSLGGNGARSPEFYAAVARSRDLLEPVLRRSYADYRTDAPADSATLLAQLTVEGDSAARVERALGWLSDAISIDVDLPTSLVKVSVVTGSAGLSADLANELVRVVDDFNSRSRRSQARRRSEFVEERRVEAQAALRAAENALDRFYASNRAWDNSPPLRTVEARLRQAVSLRQDLFVTLSREAETARIEAVDDAPVISIVQHATPPRFRSAPRRTLIVLAAAVLGVLLAACWTASSVAVARWRAARGAGRSTGADDPRYAGPAGDDPVGDDRRRRRSAVHRGAAARDVVDHRL